MLDETIDTNRGTVTTNHEMITQWVEKYDGCPATDETTAHSIEYLRIKFPSKDAHDELVTVGWREWLQEFEAQELAFVYRDDENEDPSQVYKFVDRTTAAEHA